MKESTTYQAIVREGREEGRTEEARRMLLLQGETKFGRDAAARAQIEGIADLARLEELGVRIVKASSWEELLAPAVPRRRNGRKARG
jgi:hypothetical protein